MGFVYVATIDGMVAHTYTNGSKGARKHCYGTLELLRMIMRSKELNIPSSQLPGILTIMMTLLRQLRRSKMGNTRMV